MPWRRTIATRHDREECERRIWLLNGEGPETGSGGKYTTYIWAEANETGFTVRVINVTFTAQIREASMALHGRWSEADEGTEVTIWYVPRPWFALSLSGVLIFVVGLGVLDTVNRDAYQYVAGDMAGWLVAAAFVAFAVLAIMAAGDLRADVAGKLVDEALRRRDDLDPGSDPGRRSNRQRRRRR